MAWRLPERQNPVKRRSFDLGGERRAGDPLGPVRQPTASAMLLPAMRSHDRLPGVRGR